MNSQKVLVVLVNYRQPDLTIRCLKALKQQTYKNIEVVVVDNASNDDVSLSLLQTYQTEPNAQPFILQTTPYNGGFAYGNNWVIKPKLQDSDIDYFWLLNNDTEPEPEALAELITKARILPGSLVGSQMTYLDGRPQASACQVNRWTGAITHLPIHTDTQQIDALSGASLLIPRQVFNHIGLMEDRFFLYWEDTEFCLRAKAAGYALLLAQASIVRHVTSASTNTDKSTKQFYMRRNRWWALWPYISRLQKCRMLLGDAYQWIRLFGRCFRVLPWHASARYHQASLYWWAIWQGLNPPTSLRYSSNHHATSALTPCSSSVRSSPTARSK